MESMITKTKTAELVAKYQQHGKDSGTPSVQVALLTERIREVSEHLKTHKKDHSSQLGLLKMVGDRKSLLTYLKRTKQAEYDKLIKQLELRK